MTVKLYGIVVSPAVRSVIFTLEALNVPYELKIINLKKGEHLTEEFLKMNPQHTVPTIQDDDGFTIWESHAINAYLVNKYGKNDKLYPKEPKARAVVDQRLYFDNGVLFESLVNVLRKILRQKTATKMTDELIALIEEGYNFLEKFLADRQFAAGNDITIADFSIASTLANSSILAPIKKEKYPLITEYLKRCESRISSFKKLNEEALKFMVEYLQEVNFEIPTQ